jgi:hypothetical protein
MHGPWTRVEEFHESLRNYCPQEPCYRVVNDHGYQGLVDLVPQNLGYNGPEISLARNLSREIGKSDSAQTNKICIIKVAKGGTGIRAFLPVVTAYVDRRYTPEKAHISADACKGPLYKLIKEQIDILGSIPSLTPKYRGIVMKQGGKDTNRAPSSAGYLEQVNHVVEQLRDDTNTPGMPFYITTYWSRQELDAIPPRVFDDIVGGRPHAMDIFRNLAEPGNAINNYRVIHHGWLPVGPDGTHFSAESQQAFGSLIAAKMLRTEFHYSYNTPSFEVCPQSLTIQAPDTDTTATIDVNGTGFQDGSISIEATGLPPVTLQINGGALTHSFSHTFTEGMHSVKAVRCGRLEASKIITVTTQ